MGLYKKPSLTYFFIILFSFIFLLQLYYTMIYGEELFYSYGFSLQNVLSGRVYVFLTSVFLHGDASHIILNMIALFFFGRVVEQELGRKKFLLIFFLSAIVGNIAVLSSNLLGFGSGIVPTIGASAAIFGLIGAGMLVKPFELVFYPYLIPVPLIMVALVYTLYNIAELLLVVVEGVSSNISYVSHLGGLAGGMIFGFKQEGSRRGLIVLLFLVLLMVLTPFMLILFSYLEIFNYVAFFSGLLK